MASPNLTVTTTLEESGLKGVYPWPTGTWYASIMTDGVKQYLGSFSTKEEAHAAYAKAAADQHREFARAA